ncbi:DctP family TRAP transporter solute-binding subunit [Alkalibacillus almallahensis]|uniref:DctP family TRAP transporter solute-binding subunit n=1 Tax=Alkalibacillus almallahensis TaxID=1379154 RepID=UPI00141E1CAC|nr:DctP family TRAP transporter solute-binding subunit [Alkalibacillus almallahensis]NIK11907.1 tripartite ATP-independent transporter DctP family solute receptor [Alkalibacillus almallahensis]
MIIFNKKSFILALMIFLTLGLLAACGGGDDTSSEGDGSGDTEESSDSEGSSDSGSDSGDTEFEEDTWRFVTEEVEGQVQYVYAEEFGKRISEKTNGAITVEPYEFGGLGSETDQVDQLMQGTVEMAVMSPGFTGNMVDEGQLFALQFLFPTDQATTQEILNNSEALNTDLREQYEEHSITPLAYWSEGAMQWTSNDHPLKTPEDFENFQMRVQTSPLIMESYEQYGANPQEMSWGELYTALDRGTVEGQENPIFFIGDASFHEVQDYLTMSNHNNYVAMTTVNTEWFNGLDEELQTIVEETVTEMQDWVFEEQKAQNEEYLEVIKNDEENPTDVVELTDEEVATFREEAKEVREFYRNEVSTVDGAILDKLEEEIAEYTE